MIVEMIEKHPMIAIGGLVGFVALILLSKKSGGGSVAVYTPNASANNQVAASTQVALRQIDAQENIAKLNSTVEMQKSISEANVARANRNASLASTAIQARTAQAINGSNNSTQEFNNVMSITGANARAANQTAQVNATLVANSSYASKKLSTDLAMQTNNLNAQLQLAGRQLDTVDMKNTYDFTLASRGQELNSANLPRVLQTQENLALINSNTATSNAQTSQATMLTLAGMSANALQSTTSKTQQTSIINSLISQLGPTAAKYLGSILSTGNAAVTTVGKGADVWDANLMGNLSSYGLGASTATTAVDSWDAMGNLSAWGLG